MKADGKTKVYTLDDLRKMSRAEREKLLARQDLEVSGTAVVRGPDGKVKRG